MIMVNHHRAPYNRLMATSHALRNYIPHNIDLEQIGSSRGPCRNPSGQYYQITVFDITTFQSGLN